MRKMKYYIGYVGKEASGNINIGHIAIEVDAPLDSMAEIKHITEFIENQYNMHNVEIMGTIRLYGDEEKDAYECVKC